MGQAIAFCGLSVRGRKTGDKNRSPVLRLTAAKSLRGTRFRLSRLILPILRRSRRLQRPKQALRHIRNLINRRQERSLIRLRGLRKPANLPHKLQRSSANLSRRNRRIKVEKRLDVPAHRLAPHLVRNLNYQRELGPLLILRDDVAFLRAGEAALRAHAELVDVNKLRRFINAALEKLLGF